MENSGCRFPLLGVEFNEQTTKSSSRYSKRMRVGEEESVFRKFPKRLMTCLSANLCVLSSRVFMDVPQ